MNWHSINFSLDYLASTGTCFSVEHRTAIQSSLILLQNDNHFKEVQFWGKINGMDNDYFIVCGIGNDFIKDRTFFYSTNNGIKWIRLPPPTENIVELGLSCTGLFYGDPAANSPTALAPNGGYDISENDDFVFIKEEERLSATIKAINDEAAIVPRGALYKDPTGLCYRNKTFEGIPKENANELHFYYHLRPPLNEKDKNIVSRADYNVSLDFLDSIADDIPLGCWAFQFDHHESIALIRSLFWPGFVAFQLLHSPHYGSIYVGTGKKNWDLPFMISKANQASTASVNDSTKED